MPPESSGPPTGSGPGVSPPVDPVLSAGEVKRRATRAAVLLTGRGVAIRGLGFVGTLVLASLLVPQDFGVLALGLTVWTVGTFLQDGGLGAYLIRREEAPEQEDLQSLVGFQLAATLLVTVAVAAIAAPLGEAGAVTAVMVASLPIQALRTPTVIVLERRLTYRTIAIVELAEVLVYNALAVGLVAAGLGVWGVAAAFVLRTIAGTALMLALGPVGATRPRMDVARLRLWLSFGVQYQSVAVVHLIRDQGLNTGVAAVAGLRALGIYALTTRLLQVLLLGFEGLWRVSYPAMAQLLRIDADPGVLVGRISRLTALGTGAAVVGLAGSAPSLIPALFGDEWVRVLDILPWALAGLMLSGPVSVACAGFLFAAGAARPVLLGAIWHTSVAFLVALPLLPLLGLTAVGLGLLGASIVEAVALGRATVKRTSWKPLGDLAPPNLAAAGAAAASWWLASGGDPSIWRAAVAAVVAEALFVLAMLLMQRATVADLIGVGRGAMTRGEATGP